MCVRVCNLAMLFCFYWPTLDFHGFCMDCYHNLAASLCTVHSVTHGFLKFTSDYVTSLLKSFDFSLNIKYDLKWSALQSLAGLQLYILNTRSHLCASIILDYQSVVWPPHLCVPALHLLMPLLGPKPFPSCPASGSFHLAFMTQLRSTAPSSMEFSQMPLLVETQLLISCFICLFVFGTLPYP